MDKLNVIYKCKYNTSQEAIEHCQLLAHCIGFSIRIRTSKANTIYIVCSREGKPEQDKPINRRRNRFSDRCECHWRVVLFNDSHLNPNNKWEFRAGKSMVHNHSLLTSKNSPNKGVNTILKRYPFKLIPQPPISNTNLPSLSTILNEMPYHRENNKMAYNKDHYNNDPIEINYSCPSTEGTINTFNSPVEKTLCDKSMLTLPPLFTSEKACFSINNNFHQLPIQNFKQFGEIMSLDLYRERSRTYPTIQDLLN